MRTSAILGKKIVLDAAEPVEPGDSISTQKARSYKNLHLVQLDKGGAKVGETILNDAWHDRLGPGQFETLLDMAIKSGRVRLEFASERMPRTDPDFMDSQVIGMRWAKE